MVLTNSKAKWASPLAAASLAAEVMVASLGPMLLDNMWSNMRNPCWRASSLAELSRVWGEEGSSESDTETEAEQR